jgi:hypothetical protein
VDSATSTHFTTVHGGGTTSMYDSIASILKAEAGSIGYKTGITAGVVVTMVLCCIGCCLRRWAYCISRVGKGKRVVLC